ncbi:MAG: class I SAM-dependent methyltransferase, partial [Anaerolineales bacterium]
MTETYSTNFARDMDKAALRGEPSYLWRDGQERRLSMIVQAAGDRINGRVLDNGCGLGAYLGRLAEHALEAHGLEFDEDRARQAADRLPNIVQAAGEALPYPSNSFDLILSREVIEHVQDDRQAVAEMVRTLAPGGRVVLYVPN